MHAHSRTVPRHISGRAILTAALALALATLGLSGASAQTPVDPDKPGNIQLFFGDAANPGSFSQQQTLAVPGTPIRVVAGDFNADGQRDLMVSECDDSGCRIQLFPNTGDGTFGDPTAFPLPMLPGAMGAANIDGSPGDDLVLGFSQPELEYFEPRTVALYLAPAFGTPARTFQSDSAEPSDVAFGQLTDGDDALDWAVAGHEGTVIFRNRGGDDISTAPVIPCSGMTAVAIARSSGDNWNDSLDVYSACGANLGDIGAINVSIDVDGDASFTKSAYGIETDNQPLDFVVSDFNGDGFEDMVAVNTGSSQLSLGQGHRSGYRHGPEFMVPTEPDPFRILPAKLAPNGPTGLLVANGNATFTAFRNTSQKGGGLRFAPTTTGCDSGPGVDLAVSDLNGDGADDVVFASCYKAPPPTPTPAS